MIHFAAICLILLLARMSAAYDDSYAISDDPDALFEESKRRGGQADSFIRLGRSELIGDYDYSGLEPYSGARPTRGEILNNNDRFIRFGRADRAGFMRFGRSPLRNGASFLRFGRDSEEYVKAGSKPKPKKLRESNKFARGDIYLRFGRGVAPTTSSSSAESFRQSEWMQRQRPDRLLQL